MVIAFQFFPYVFQHTVGDTDTLCAARAWGPPDRLAMCEKVLGVKASSASDADTFHNLNHIHKSLDSRD